MSGVSDDDQGREAAAALCFKLHQHVDALHTAMTQPTSHTFDDEMRVMDECIARANILTQVATSTRNAMITYRVQLTIAGVQK